MSTYIAHLNQMNGEEREECLQCMSVCFCNNNGDNKGNNINSVAIRSGTLCE